MGSVRVKRDKLFFDFRYRGMRCREQTALSDTAANRKLVQGMLSRIEAEITLGTFDYAKYFPGSHNATKLAQATASNASGASAAGTPLYGAFAETWYLEGEPLWRRSHKATIRSTLDRHLVPAFGKQGVGEISKADCLAFRARLAKLPGRAGNDVLSAKTVNRIMQIHSQILAEASERYGFANPTDRIKRMKQPKVDIHPFSLDEVQRMVDTVRADYRDYLVVRFFTGMRTGEINGLQWRYGQVRRQTQAAHTEVVRR